MIKIILFVCVFIPLSGLAQVGINTTSPTATLDVNGNARIRSFTQQGTVLTDASGNLNVTPVRLIATGKVAANGTALRISGATVTKVAGGRYLITFTTPRPDANYIILLTASNLEGDVSNDDPDLGYRLVTNSNFEVLIGNNDNGGTSREAAPLDLEFSFVVYDIN